MSKAYIATVKDSHVELSMNGGDTVATFGTETNMHFFATYKDAHDFCNRMMEYDWCRRASVSLIWNGISVSPETLAATEITYFERA